jgi:hypothetical protein
MWPGFREISVLFWLGSCSCSGDLFLSGLNIIVAFTYLNNKNDSAKSPLKNLKTKK